MCYALIPMLAMAAVSLVSGAVQAKGARDAGKANNAIAENNAVLATEQGKDAAIQGARESQKQAWATRAAIGAQRAAIAAQGVDSSLGTPFDIQSDTALFGGVNQSAIALDAARKAWGFNVEAQNYRNQGKLGIFQSKVQSTTSLLGGLSNAIGSFSGYGGGGAKVPAGG